VTVAVQPRTEPPVVVPDPAPIEPDQPLATRPSREGTKPIAERMLEAAATPTTAEVVTLPSTRSCVSRRRFSIRIAKRDYRSVDVRVNGKRVKVARNRSTVDLRGLPRGRFKVQIAVTLKDGKVVRSTRRYRTCTAKKRGGRA
jgi:hypothetical protein